MIWKHSSSLGQMWKLRTADVGFCTSKGIGMGAMSVFDTCLSLVNHLAFLSKRNHMTLENCEVNTLKVVFCSASHRKRHENWMEENQNSERWGTESVIPSVRWINIHSMGWSAFLKCVLFSKGLKLSVTHVDMSLYYNYNVGSGLPVFQKLVLLLPYYVNSFNGACA